MVSGDSSSFIAGVESADAKARITLKPAGCFTSSSRNSEGGKRLVGTGRSGPSGGLMKMSKSLNNAIFLSDDADTVQKKVMGMYTDPKRLKATDPGETDPEKNPLWAFHETFNSDQAWVSEHRDLYKNGKIGDVAIKRKLVEILNALIDPIRTKRKHFEQRPDDVLDALRQGTKRANVIAEETLALAKKALRQDYFPRSVSFVP